MQNLLRLGYEKILLLASIIFREDYLPSSIKFINLSGNSLNREALVKLFEEIPSTVESINLDNNDLYRVFNNTNAFIEAFEKLPDSIKSIGLGDPLINIMNGDVLAKEFNGLPKSIRTIHLNGSETGTQFLVGLLQKKSELKECIDLSSSCFYKKSNVALINIFEKLPNSIDFESINLSGNTFSTIELIEVIKALPQFIKHIDLSKNNLGGKTPEEIITIFEALPRFIESIDLSDNALYNINGEALASAFQALPTSIQFIKLGGNTFSTQISEDSDEAFTDLLSQSSIYLNDKVLCKQSSEELIKTLKGLPRSIKFIDLSESNFGDKNDTELAQIFKALPESIEFVDLSNNDLYKKSGKALANILKELPESVTSVNLNENALSLINDEELQTILTNLPGHIKSILSDIPEYLIPPYIASQAVTPDKASSNHQPTGSTITQTSQHGVILYLRNNSSENALKRISAHLKKQQPIDVTMSSLVDLFLAISEIKTASLKAKDNECGTKTRALLSEIRELALTYTDNKSSEASRTQAQEKFGAKINQLSPFIKKIFPLSWKSVLATLFIAATGVGLILLAAHRIYTGSFFVKQPDFYRTSNALKDIKKHPQLVASFTRT